MKFEKYNDLKAFGNDTLEVLLENEVQNNLPIGFITDSGDADTSDWFLATVKDDSGGVLLTAACTPPFNIVLYETGNRPNDAAIKLLSDEMKSLGISLPGILAEQNLARRFSEIHVGSNQYHRHLSMNIMRLDKVAAITTAKGHLRPLRESDLFFVPYWEKEFGIDCNLEFYDIPTNVERVNTRLDKDVHYIWEDEFPVSQAVHGRSTLSGAVVNGVYTPPHYRGHGYASSLVAGLSKILLEKGNKFCCLFADAKNPISCGIYRKLGYYDLCVFDELKFKADAK